MAPGVKRRMLILLILSGLSAVPAAAVASASSASDTLKWEQIAAFSSVGPVRALRVLADGAVAVGTDRALWWWSGKGAPRRILGAGPVRDLAVAGDGRLLVATDRGVYRREPDGAWQLGAPGPGRARHILRLAATSKGLFCGTEAGVFHSEDGLHWQALAAGPTPGVVSAVAEGRGAAGEMLLWVVRDGELLRIELEGDAQRLRVLGQRVVRWPRSPREILDLQSDPRSGELRILAARSLGLGTAQGWRWVRLVLPPGATPQRMLQMGDRVWIATDRGLGAASWQDGSWQRAARPVGATPTAVLATHARAVWAAGEQGVWRGSPQTKPSRDLHQLRKLEEGLPPITAVQRAALHYLGLDPARMRALRRGVDRRGWLPTLELRSGIGRRRKRGRNADQKFTSGALHFLVDRDQQRDRDMDVSAVLRWDLGDTLYHPEAVDVSRESRAVIELRDQVFDEIDQLYYERRRVLLDWAAKPDPKSLEAQRLRLRAEELGAGLDAWTGGWWSARTRRPALTSPRDPATEILP